MIELRWVSLGKQRHLQYRTALPSVDASGAFCPPLTVTEWMDVNTSLELVRVGGVNGE